MNWKLCLFLTVIISMADKSENKLEELKHNKRNKAVVCRMWPILTDFDANLCTHFLLYGTVSIDEMSSRIKSIDEESDLHRFRNNPHIKILLSVGEQNDLSYKFVIAADREKRAKLITSVINYLEQNELHGLNVDWTYPPEFAFKPEDREIVVTLIKDLKEAFRPHGYILTATISHSSEIIKQAYDLVSLNHCLDLIIVASYSYHSAKDKVVGPMAPLRGYNKTDVYNVEYTIKYMLSFGISAHKLVLGLALYGRTYILTDPNVTEIELGKTAAEIRGIYAYGEVCLELKNGSWSYHWDNRSSTPYIRDGQRVISYESTRSIANKVKMAVDYNLGGFMIWSLWMDDKNGVCDLPNDTYIDYIDRYDSLTKVFQKSSNDLYLLPGDFEGNGYRISNELIFNVPEEKFTNYPLLRTVKQAIGIALEEKEINDAIQRVRKSKNMSRWKTAKLGPFKAQHKTPCVETCTKLCYD